MKLKFVKSLTKWYWRRKHARCTADVVSFEFMNVVTGFSATNLCDSILRFGMVPIDTEVISYRSCYLFSSACVGEGYESSTLYCVIIKV